MSVSADVSLMDILFDSSEDPVLKFVDDRDVFKQEFDGFDVKSELLSDKPGNWVTDPDDLLNDILSDEHFDLLDKTMDDSHDDSHNEHYDVGMSDWKPVTHDGSGIKEIVVGSGSSTYSDSGLSSDQVSPGLPHDYDFSPRQLDDDDEHLSSAVSTISDSSIQQMTMNDIKYEPQYMDYMDAVEQEQAVLGILPQESQASLTGKKKVRQVVNVAPTSVSNPRSVLLPVNTANGVKTYKIVNAGNSRKALKALATLSGNNAMLLKTLRPVLKNVKNPSIGKKMKARAMRTLKEMSDEDEDEEVTVVSDSDDDKMKSQYPRLILSPEEKKLMQKEGVTLPSHYPLTKFEERELKRIRRKIRNKISAQDSRKRKKEYLDGLEDRVKQCTEENLSLIKKIKYLQSQNQSLMAQLKKLQLTLARTTTKTAQPATCLMVLMLSVALVMAPNLRLTQNNDTEVSEQDISVPDQTLPPIAGRTRSLLSKPNLQEECLSTEEEESKRIEMQDQYYRSSMGSPDPNSDMSSVVSACSRKSSYVSGSMGYDSPLHFFADHDYDPPPSKRNRLHFDDHKIRYDFESYDEQPSKKDFIIPPLDDVWPAQKIEKALKPKEFLIPDVDDHWAPKHSTLVEKIETLTAEVKVNISDAKGTRTVVIQVPKEKK